VTPYAYCASDPINNMDQTGKDIWEIDFFGRIVKRIKTQKYTIRVITHSHPFTKKASQDDTLNKIGVLNIWGNNRDTIKFRIYYPFTKDSGVFNNY